MFRSSLSEVEKKDKVAAQKEGKPDEFIWN